MYESRKQPILPRRRFARRLLTHSATALGLLAFSLGIGMAGYVAFENLSWIDAFLNASMILSGMGPVDRMDTAPAKLFSALYALFSGLVFIGVVGVVVAPWIHRLYHWFHLGESSS